MNENTAPDQNYPQDIADLATNLSDLLTSINSNYNPDGSHRSHNLHDDLINSITDEFQKSATNSLVNAQIQASSMYTVNVLFWILLKINGIDPTNIDGNGKSLMAEIQLVQDTIGRVQETEKLLKTTRVDRSAVKRILKHHLPKPEEKK